MLHAIGIGFDPRQTAEIGHGPNGRHSGAAISFLPKAPHRRSGLRRPFPRLAGLARNRLQSPIGKKGSVATQAASSKPMVFSTRDFTSCVVLGTMRSTMVAGNRTSAPIQSASEGSRARAKSTVTLFSACPLWGRLSQLSRVNGLVFFVRRAANVCTIRPMAERGASGASKSWDNIGMIEIERAG